MGLDDADLVEDVDGGGKTSSVFCSICLEAVVDDGERSWVKLQCGHEFHLDCIGSAFNTKGAMQCPNCRKIEKGQWLFANSGSSFSDFGMDHWTHYEDLYDLGYSEMSFGVHWCPFSGLTRLPSSFDSERGFSSSVYLELLGQHAAFAEHTTVSSASHPCPYIAYFGPIPHLSSSNSNGNVSDGFNYNSHWNGSPVPNELPNYAFPSMDVHYHSWEHHLSPFPTASSHVGAADQSSNPSVAQRAPRANSEIPRLGSFLRPFFVGNSSTARAGISVATSMIPPYPGSVARARDRVQAIQAYFQQPSNSPTIHTPLMSNTRRSGSQRGTAPVGPVPSASPSDQTTGFPFFSLGPSGGNLQEVDNHPSSHSHNWQREHFPSFPLGQVDQDAGWRPIHQSASGSDTGIRSSSFHGHISEWMPSHRL